MALQWKTDTEKERVYELIRRHTNTHVVEGNGDGVIIDGYISFDTMSEIVGYLSARAPKKELFEECWVAYKRKGSKKKALEYWKKLTDEEKTRVMPHITHYVLSRDRQYQKDFERYLRDRTFNDVVSSGNSILFDPQRFTSGKYEPNGKTIWFNESTQSYWSTDNFYYGTLDDGYTDDNRPDGASITLNNARGTVVWSAVDRKWIKQ